MDFKHIDPELIITAISSWGSPLSIAAVVFLMLRLFIHPLIPPFTPGHILSEGEYMMEEIMHLFEDHLEELADTGLYSRFTIDSLRNRRHLLGQSIEEANEEAGLSSSYTYITKVVAYWKESKQCRQELKALRREIQRQTWKFKTRKDQSWRNASKESRKPGRRCTSIHGSMV
ncbi:uncharacterized protein EV420DRAFT_1481816 [Desarmillaria tabescens]|uniref:Uncharacterized protein n=1 Tax=Armillaria tabescens TaxID=1929756 RepID=A0AA39K8D3_ARMTA|nr:uncharacterized protein EV420DRAFT_1481816 [Desarmillaria tabescens]KAK0454108.1 hypothetical protein EV420DRAFT_1481816 [Desarmillaria tabescens]